MTTSDDTALGGRSAVIVSVPLPARLRALRLQNDHNARQGIPPHVTLLFPFAPADALTRPVREDLARVAASHEPFAVAFRAVRAFRTVVYLAPEPSAPFLGLTSDLFTAFPAYPPYDGEIEMTALIPHLTMAEDEHQPVAALVREIASSLPFEVVVRTMVVITEDDRGRWSVRWRLRLGGGA